jgi:hypothetical protein
MAEAEAARRFEGVIDAWSNNFKRDLLAQVAQLRGEIITESRGFTDSQRESFGRQVWAFCGVFLWFFLWFFCGFFAVLKNWFFLFVCVE